MEGVQPTTARVYSPMQISFAAFIGSPAAACWCFACNFRRFGQPKVAQTWMIWGCGSSFVLLVLICLLPFPQKCPHYIIPLAYSLAFREIAGRIHGDPVERYIAAGGRLASWWFVAGISILFFIAVFAALIAALFVLHGVGFAIGR